jgi:adenine-specific DNA-methyltransferase
LPAAELLVVKQFGDPIFPTLVPMDAVQNGPADAPWHTLIEADNYHALQLLEYLYASKVDCIYIDPPYNSGARDWKYNNDFVDRVDSWRHSKWLSMIQKRLIIAKRLLKPKSGVLIVTIDENELYHLGVLISECFPEYLRQMVTIVINPKGTGKANFARVEEQALYCFPNVEGGVAQGVSTSIALSPEDTDVDATSDSGEEHVDTSDKSHLNPNFAYLWEKRHARRRGSESSYRHQRWNQFYPIFIDEDAGKVVRTGPSIPLGQEPDFSTEPDGLKPIWPIDHEGNHRCWRFVSPKMQELIDSERVVLGKFNKKKRTWTINIWERKPNKTKLKTVWWDTLHDAGTHGTTLLDKVLKRRGAFAFPKSVYAVRDTILPIVGDRTDALIVDFFAGSGTTLNAVALINSVDQGQRRCIMVTNNEVSAKEAASLSREGYDPSHRRWEAHGVCRSVTWPRTKFTFLGHRDDNSPLVEDFLTGRLVEKQKRRTFRHAAFVAPEDFRVADGLSETAAKKAAKTVQKKKLAFVGMIDAIPQNSVTPGCRFIVSEDQKASVLFDPDAAAEWLEALEEQDHITDFYIVAEDDKQFKAIKAQVDDLLGPLIVQEEEKRPMSAGFAANVAYFKLDFLDKDRVELGAAFREILPLLWMKAGAIGPAPALPEGPLPDFFVPEGSPFAVLLTETRVAAFQQALQTRKQLRHIFIVTDAEEAFRALSADLRSTLAADSPEAEFVQLYRDYLVNFTINTRANSAASGQGGAA